eukprot:TRINITY_DN15029_c0_g1_i1.p1 TRINITY_DN15029_c0_g1~~TRINITY_DN15029_c0_g1_i1.p1  ORF type:complete len:679 (+),score=107.46 TRINITY_DN15029_c0_g1_i1:63-2099(+)
MGGGHSKNAMLFQRSHNTQRPGTASGAGNSAAAPDPHTQSDDAAVHTDSLTTPTTAGPNSYLATSVQPVTATVVASATATQTADSNDEIVGIDDLPVVSPGRQARPCYCMRTFRSGDRPQKPSGFRAIHIAAQGGHERCLRELVELGADPNATLEDGTTPVYIAAQTGRAECITVLASLGADVNRATTRGATAASVAAENGHDACIVALALSGADLNRADDEDGFTALHTAVFQAFEACVLALLEHGASTKVADKAGRRPVHYAVPHIAVLLQHKGFPTLLEAVRRNDIAAMQSLIQNSNVDPDEEDPRGWTALWEAVLSSAEQSVAALLPQCDLGVRDVHNLGVRLWSEWAGHPGIRQLLAEQRPLFPEEQEGLRRLTAAAEAAPEIIVWDEQQAIAAANAAPRRPRRGTSSLKQRMAEHPAELVEDELDRSLSAPPQAAEPIPEVTLYHFLREVGDDPQTWVVTEDNPPMADVLADTRVFVMWKVAALEYLLPEDAAHIFAVHVYTFESDCYKLVNTALRSGDNAQVARWRPFVYYLRAALSRFPAIPQPSAGVYRGVMMPFDPAQYAIGATVVWPAFSSTSVKWKVAYSFLYGGQGVIFLIHCRSGRDISLYSFFPPEQEVLLMPRSAFRVVRWCRASIQTLLFAEQRQLAHNVVRTPHDAARLPQILVELEELL